MSNQPHEALTVPLPERIDYLTVIASMVGADVVLDPPEIEQIRALCRALEIPDEDAKKILETAQLPTRSIVRHVENLRESNLRFTLLTDCIALAYADGDYAKGERKEIMDLAAELGVTGDQISALEEVYRSLHAKEIQEHRREHHGASAIAARLAAAGIPLGVGGGISAVGLSAAGIATGGTAVAMGLGIATGFGAVLGAGLGTVIGVRRLHEHLKSK